MELYACAGLIVATRVSRPMTQAAGLSVCIIALPSALRRWPRIRTRN